MIMYRVEGWIRWDHENYDACNMIYVETEWKVETLFTTINIGLAKAYVNKWNKEITDDTFHHEDRSSLWITPFETIDELNEDTLYRKPTEFSEFIYGYNELDDVKEIEE